MENEVSASLSISQNVPAEAIDHYLELLSSGNAPSIEEYASRFGPQANSVREALEVICLLEKLGSTSCDSTIQVPAKPSLSRLSDFLDRTIDDYHIVREIGRGGMGVVFEATQLSLGRRVALKLIPKNELTQSKLSLRFDREAKAAAMLHHTNIVPIFAVGETSECQFYVMQYINGDSLDRILATLNQRSSSLVQRDFSGHSSCMKDVVDESQNLTPLDTLVWQLVNNSFPDRKAHSTTLSSNRTSEVPVPGVGVESNSSHHFMTNQASLSSCLTNNGMSYWHSVARIGLQIASALSYAHAQGVLHRDIKPSNLLLDAHGAIWLADFGLAKLQNDNSLTMTGDIVGTLRYMSPESFQGQYDERSEVFCLGLTLYELCAKSPVYGHSDRFELIDEIRGANIKPLDRTNPGIPIDLSTIIGKCLERNPTDRYASADDLQADLGRFLSREPILARKASIPERIVRWIGRNRQLSAALAITACVLVLTSVGAILVASHMSIVAKRSQLLSSENSRLAKDADEERRRVERTLRLVETARDEAVRLTYAQALSKAAANVLSGGKTIFTDRTTNEWRTSEMKQDPRQWEWHWLRSHQHQERHLIYAHAADVRCVQFQPKGTLLASCGVADGVRIWDRKSGEEVSFFPQPLSVAADWSPDGTQLVTVSANRDLLRFNMNSGAVDRFEIENSDPFYSARSVKWNHQQNQIALAINSRLELRDAINLQLIKATPNLSSMEHESRSLVADWSPSDEKIAWAVEQDIYILDKNLKQLLKLPGPEGQVLTVKWFSETELQSVYRSGIIRRFSIGEGHLLSETSCEAAEAANGVTWNRDGTKLVIANDNFIAICDSQTGITKFTIPTFANQFRFYPVNVSLSDDDCCLSLAYAGMAAPVPIWYLDDLKPTELDQALNVTQAFELHGPANYMSWSPDGSTLATLSDEVKLWDIRARKQIGSLAMPLESQFKGSTEIPTIARDISFSPNGEFIAATKHKFYLWNAHSHKLISEEVVPSKKLRSISWNSDSSLIAVGSHEEGNAIVYQPNGNTPHVTLPIELNYCSSIHFHPHQQTLLFANKRQVLCWDLKEQKTIWQINQGQGFENLFRWSPRGDQFIVNGENGSLQVYSQLGSLLSVLEGHEESIRSLSWSSNGHQVASVDRNGMLIVWDMRSHREAMRIFDDAICADWSPTQPILAVARGNGNVAILDACPSYSSELPEDFHIEHHSLDAKSRCIKMARENRWNEIPHAKLSNPVCLGWWTTKLENSESIEQAALHRKSPDQLHHFLEWLQPMESSKGAVICQHKRAMAIMPIYSEAATSVDALISTEFPISLNGSVVQCNGVHERPDLLRAKLSLSKGWNWCVIKTPEVSPRDTLFFRFFIE